jgi:hypothetical protein
MLPQYVLKVNEYMVKNNVSFNEARYLIMKENMNEYIKALQDEIIEKHNISSL